MIFPAEALEAQVYDIVKGVDPSARVCICSSNDWKTDNGEAASVVSGRVGRIGKGLLPPFDVEI